MNIKANGPEWAMGCERCKYGIADEVPLTGAVETYLERMVNAADGNVTFCDCRAGQMQRRNLGNKWKSYQSSPFDELGNARRLIAESPKYMGEESAITPTIRRHVPVAPPAVEPVPEMAVTA